MKNNKIKLIGLLCVFLGLTACNSGGSGSAYQNTTGSSLVAQTEAGCFQFNPETGEITELITPTSGKCDVTPSIVFNIPESIVGKPVVIIGDFVFSGRNFESVTIPNSVKTIGEDAFYDNKLTSVIMHGELFNQLICVEHNASYFFSVDWENGFSAPEFYDAADSSGPLKCSA